MLKEVANTGYSSRGLMPPTYADFLIVINDSSHSYDVTTLSDVSTEIGKGDGRIKSLRNDSQTTSKADASARVALLPPGRVRVPGEQL